MENSSLPTDVWNNVTTSLSEDNDIMLVRDLAFKVIYIITGVVGVLDNLFVIIIFIFFIKIADKVLTVAVPGKNIWGAWPLIIWEVTTAKRNYCRSN